MNFGWKFLLPVAIVNVILTATVAVLPLELISGRAARTRPRHGLSYGLASRRFRNCSSCSSAGWPLGCAVAMVAQRNPLYSAISLVGVFVSLACLYVTLAGAVHRGHPGHRLRGRDHGAGRLRHHAAQRRGGGAPAPASDATSSPSACCWRRCSSREAAFMLYWAAVRRASSRWRRRATDIGLTASIGDGAVHEVPAALRDHVGAHPDGDRRRDDARAPGAHAAAGRARQRRGGAADLDGLGRAGLEARRHSGDGSRVRARADRAWRGGHASPPDA